MTRKQAGLRIRSLAMYSRSDTCGLKRHPLCSQEVWSCANGRRPIPCAHAGGKRRTVDVVVLRSTDVRRMIGVALWKFYELAMPVRMRC